VWAEQRPSERTKDSDTIRWAGWRDREHLRDTLGVRIKTVGEDEGIGAGLVCTELDSCTRDYVLPWKDKLLELLSSRRIIVEIFADPDSVQATQLFSYFSKSASSITVSELAYIICLTSPAHPGQRRGSYSERGPDQPWWL
jgi:hypothetical protein